MEIALRRGSGISRRHPSVARFRDAPGPAGTSMRPATDGPQASASTRTGRTPYPAARWPPAAISLAPPRRTSSATRGTPLIRSDKGRPPQGHLHRLRQLRHGSWKIPERMPPPLLQQAPGHTAWVDYLSPRCASRMTHGAPVNPRSTKIRRQGVPKAVSASKLQRGKGSGASRISSSFWMVSRRQKRQEHAAVQAVDSWRGG